MSSALGEGAPFTQVEQDGTAETLTYTLPNAGRFDVDSVVATIDNAAGPDIHPILYLAAPNGEIIAKKVQSELIPAGDTGSATWALRLADSGAAAAGIPSLSVGIFQAHSLGASPWTWDFLNTNDPALYSIDGVDARRARIAAVGSYLAQFTYNGNFVITAPFRFTGTLFDNSDNPVQLQFLADWDDASAGDPAQINWLFGNGLFTPGGDPDAPFYIQLDSSPAGPGGTASLTLVRVSPTPVV